MEEIKSNFDQLDIEEAVNKVIIDKSKILDLSTCSLTSSAIRRIVTHLLDHDISNLEKINLSNCGLILDLDSACNLDMLLSSNPHLKAFIMLHNPSSCDEQARKCLYEALDRLKIPHLISYTVIEKNYLLNDEVEQLEYRLKMQEKLNQWRGGGKSGKMTWGNRRPIPRLSQISPSSKLTARMHCPWGCLEDFPLIQHLQSGHKDFSYLNFSAFVVFDSSKGKDGQDCIVRLNLSKCEMPSYNFYRSNLDGSLSLKSTLAFACFKNAYMANIHWYQTNLTEANLQNAIFDFSHLIDCNLCRTNAQHASFKFASLSFTYFGHSDLSSADFEGAIFSHANLGAANLRKANFHLTNFSKANICGADLRDTNLSTVKSWKKTFWYGAILPEYSLHDEKLDFSRLASEDALRKVLEKLFEKLPARFENLSLAELKTLYVQGQKDRRLKPFVEKYAIYLKDICRHKVYGLYLAKFNLFPKVLTELIIHKAGTPYSPFLNKKAINDLTRHKFFKPLRPPSMALTFFTHKGTFEGLILLLENVTRRSLRIAALQTGKDHSKQLCFRGALEGNIKLLYDFEKEQWSLNEKAEQDIQEYFSNHMLPSFRINEKFNLPSQITLGSASPLPNTTDKHQTFLLMMKPTSISFLSEIMAEFMKRGIAINAIKTGVVSTKAFKKISKIAGAAYETQLTHFMKTPVLMIVVKTTETNLKNYAGAEEAFIILKNVEKDMRLFFEPTELVFAEANPAHVMRKG